MNSQLLPGNVLLDKYVVERHLGAGGMGDVYAVRHRELSRLYAMKLMLPSKSDSSGAGERFLREARLASSLQSEHVAKVTDTGRLDTGELYMVMEYLDGSDLKKILQDRGSLPVGEAAALLLQACEAISEAHSLSIVHRDIKPANLFVIRRRNGAPCLKVLDFGISKNVAEDQLDLTKSGMMLGSLSYMSPEQISHSKDVDARADIWSLGVVLYELVTGRKPFAARDQVGVLHRVLHETPRPATQLKPGSPPLLDTILVRCLAKSADDRLQTIDELAALLEELVPPPPARRASMASISDCTISIAEATSADTTTGSGAIVLDSSELHTTTSGSAPRRRPSQEPPKPPPPLAPAPPPEISAVTVLPTHTLTEAGWNQTSGAPAPRRSASMVSLLAALAAVTFATGVTGVWLLQRRSLPASTALQGASALVLAIARSSASAPSEAPSAVASASSPTRERPAPDATRPLKPTTKPARSSSSSPASSTRIKSFLDE